MNYLDGVVRKAEGLRRGDLKLTQNEAKALLHGIGLGKYFVDQETLNPALRKLRIIARVGA